MATVSTGGASGTATQWSGAGHVFIAPTGEGAALLFNGTNWVLYGCADAASPSWSSVTTITNSLLAGGLAAEMDRATGDIHVFYKKTGGPLPAYRKLTYGGGTWSLGSEVVLETGVDYANDAAPVTATIDRDGRVWAKYAEWVGGYQNHLWYTSDGSSFTSYFEGEPAANNGNAAHVAPAFNGGTDYLLFKFQQDGEIRWRRATTSGSVGVISALSTQGEGLYSDHSSDMAMLSDGRVMNAACPSGTDYTAPQVHIYSPSANTWDGGTTVGTNATDKYPSLATNPDTGTMYLVWSEGSGSSFAIVYREFTPGPDTWDTKVTVQAAGSNRIYTDCYCDGVTLLIICTTGTTVESFSVNVGSAPPAPTTRKLLTLLGVS